MSDPRNVAHDKKVKQEKGHEKLESDAGQKDHAADEKSADTATTPTPAAVTEHESAEHEKSTVVLSKLKEMEFHSRANVETLAGLMLTIEDELKQKEFAEPIGDLYSAQDNFQTKIAGLIETYEAKCERLKPSA